MTRILPVLALGALLVGCDSAGPEGGTPDVIAPAAFSIDTEAFSNDEARVAAGPHFLNAAARVGIVSAVVGANLVLPEMATRSVASVDPVAGEDGETFVWETVVNVFETDVELRLLADAADSRVGWTLTTENLSDDVEDGPFTFYTASTSFDGSEGSWRLFNPDVAGPVLTAEFAIDATPEVTFSVPAGRPEAGAAVTYAVDGNVKSFDFTNAAGERAVIQWNDVTGVGSIEADDYNNGERACWDEDLANVACEAA